MAQYAFPSGTVPFLFIDSAGCTALWERDRFTMWEAVDRHRTILQSLIHVHHAVLNKTVGDDAKSVFALVEEALHARETVPDKRGDDLVASLNRLARLLGTEHGGQILVSLALQQLS